MTPLGEEIEKARKGGCKHAIPCKVDMDGIPTCVEKDLVVPFSHPDDELRTICWLMIINGKLRHIAVRYHLAYDLKDNPLEAMMRTAQPRITIDGEDAPNTGHFAVFTKFLTDEQIHEQAKAAIDH